MVNGQTKNHNVHSWILKSMGVTPVLISTNQLVRSVARKERESLCNHNGALSRQKFGADPTLGKGCCGGQKSQDTMLLVLG